MRDSLRRALLATGLALGIVVCGGAAFAQAVGNGGGGSLSLLSQANFSGTSVSNSWTTVATPSITIASGTYLVHVTFIAQMATTSSSDGVCIEGTNAGTNGGGDVFANGAGNGPCTNGLATATNQLAGNAPNFVQPSATNKRAEYFASYTAGTVSFTCQAISSGTVSVYGTCVIVAQQTGS